MLGGVLAGEAAPLLAFANYGERVTVQRPQAEVSDHAPAAAHRMAIRGMETVVPKHERSGRVRPEDYHRPRAMATGEFPADGTQLPLQNTRSPGTLLHGRGGSIVLKRPSAGAILRFYSGRIPLPARYVMKRFAALFIFALLSLTAGADAQAPAREVAVSTGAITLAPGDVVRIAIWREDDLSGEFPVNENGTVIFPLLGEVRVVGIPFPTLRETLFEQYRVHLRNPSITITPLRRVNVLGEVNRPGLYEVDPTISLAGVVALAGGTNQDGDLNRIRVLRGGNVLHERVSATLSLDAFDIRSGDQILVERRNWFERNTTFVVSVLLSVTSIIITLAR